MPEECAPVSSDVSSAEVLQPTQRAENVSGLTAPVERRSRSVYVDNGYVSSSIGSQGLTITKQRGVAVGVAFTSKSIVS